MKLIITGATGFVAKEVIRQCLSKKEITSIVAVARSPVPIPEKLEAGADPSKLKSLVIKDYEFYLDEVKAEFSGAAACIWTVAITPSKSASYDFAEVKRICQTSTLNGLRAMHEAGPAAPFRFLYMSGAASERDQSKTPSYKPEYSKMRGLTEVKVMELAADLGGMETATAKPGFITQPWSLGRQAMGFAISSFAGVPSVDVSVLAAAMIEQVVNGFEKESLMPNDLIRLGKTALAK
ncbi:NAD(P)-binding protein [Xylariaceae sp. FL0255]|nr:NAD(P)-binding protein [Xylariaceae sp. FL0255]